MSKNKFDLEILRLHWVKDDGIDDKDDLCVHGEVFLKIGNEVISDSTSGSYNLRATGLYLLRTLESNHHIGEFGAQFLPCCGHTAIPSENKEEPFVFIIGSHFITHQGRHEKNVKTFLSTFS